MSDTPTGNGHSEPERVVREAIDQWRTGLNAAGDDAGPSLPAFILDALRSLPVEHRMEAMGMAIYGSVMYDDDEERDFVDEAVDVVIGAPVFVEKTWLADV